MKSWRIVIILLLCLALAGTVSCTLFGGGDEEEASQQLVKVVRGDLMISVSGSGNLDVYNEAKLTFGSGGKVDKIYVKEGDRVSKGDRLAKLDTDSLELALTQAQVVLSQAQISLRIAADNLDKAKNPYTEQDISDAQDIVDEANDYLAYTQWMLNQASSPAETKYWVHELSLAMKRLQTVQKNLEERLSTPDEDEIQLMEMQVDVAKQTLEQARQTLEQAQKQLDEATITTPFDGVVASIGAKVWDTVAALTTIVHLIDPTSMELKVDVDEIDIPTIKLNQRAIISVDALPALQLEGKVTFISLVPTVEAGVVLYSVTIEFDVPQGSDLEVGMSATADIVLHQRSNILLVPSRAIKQDSQGNPIVGIMVNEQIGERAVVIGISDGFQTEIVSGLQEGDVVVMETRAKPESTGPEGFFHR